MATKTPWTINSIRNSIQSEDTEANAGRVIAVFYGPDAEENMRRVAVSVGALEHVAIEKLETGEVLNLGLAVKDLTKQRDELLAALRHIAGGAIDVTVERSAIASLANAAIDSANEVMKDIARAKGEFQNATVNAESAPKITLKNAPVRTVAPSVNGGRWYKTAGGWQWNGPGGSGGVFPRPGGDWNGKLIPPEQAEGGAE